MIKKKEETKKVIDKNVEEITKNNKKTKKKIKSFFYLILIFIGLIIFTSLFIFKDQVRKIEKKYNNLTITSREQLIEEEKNYQFQKYIDELENNLANIQNRTNNNTSQILALQEKILALEKQLNSMPLYDSQRVDLIKLALNVKYDIADYQDYSNNLMILNSLLEDNPGYSILREKLFYLDVYKNQLISDRKILDDFDLELNEFVKENNLLKKQDGNVSKLFSNFVIVRKINNTQINTSDDFALKLEEQINRKSFSQALEIIKHNPNYEQSFIKTKNNLEINTNLNNFINDIINYLINKN